MKLNSRCLLAAAVALVCRGAWGADTYLNVFYEDAPLQGVEVNFNGVGIGQTDALGSASVEMEEGEHTVELLKDGEVISSYTFSTDEDEDAEIGITLSEDGAPVVTLEKFDEDDTAAVGVIGGVITSEDGSPIEGAIVSVSDSELETTTDAEGRYKLELPRGSYDFEIEHPEYNSISLEGVRVLANLGRVASLKLTPALEDAPKPPSFRVQLDSPIEEVLVLGTFKAQDSSYELERFATTVTDAIDIAQIARFGDSTAAAALKRVVGVTVSDGKYANVRGLDGRYISSTLNGLVMPSTDPMRRDVQLDLFPANILSGIEIQKSFSADMLGTTTGGSVRMNTRGLPDGRGGKFSISTGYNSEFTGDDIISYEGSNGDWIGYDSGLRDLPNSVETATDGGQSLTICDVSIDPDRCTDPLVAASLAVALEDDYNVRTTEANPDISVSASYGDLMDLANGEFGYYAALAYKNGTKNRVDATLNEPSGITGEYERSQKNISLSGYFVTGFEYGDANEALSKTIFLRNTDDTTSVIDGVDDEGSGIDRVILEWVERQFVSQQFSGTNAFYFGDDTSHQLDWRIGFSETERYEPDRRTYLYVNGILSTSAFERRWSDLSEDSVDVALDYTIPVYFNDYISTEFKIGGLYSDRSREVSLFRFGIREGDAADEVSFSISENLEEVLSYENFVADRVRLGANTSSTDSYNSDEEITSYYISTETEFGEDWTLMAGVRQEDFSQVLEYPNEDSASSPLESDEPLPVVSLTYRASEELQFRASFSETVSYPGLIERSESLSFDPETDDPIFGNADLEVSTIENYDLRAEYYFTDEESVSVALFNKEIDSPIERAVPDGSGSATDGTTFRNAESATVSGIEIDFNVNVIDSASVLAFVSGNVSVIESEVDLDQDSIRLEGEDSIGRELQGQAPLLGNLQLGLDHIDTEQKFTLLINYTDEKIYRVTRGDNVGPEFYDERILVDFNYEVLFGESFTFKTQLKNLLNEEVTWTQDGRDIETFEEGTSVSLSLDYEF